MLPSDYTHRSLALGILVVGLLLIIWWIAFSIEKHFADHLNGFWTADTLEGQCILYLDAGSMRLIESKSGLDNSSMKQCTYTTTPCTWWNLNMRTYDFKVDGLTSRSHIGQQLSQSGLQVDLYPIEGSCIIHNADGDILTLIKDNKASVSLLV